MTTTNWNIDQAHSSINFAVRHMVVSKVRGRFASFTGTAHLDEGDLTRSSVEARLDASSIETGTPQRDDHLRSGDFLDVARFPELRFQSSRIEALGAGRYRVVGNLTIRDVTREVALEAEYGGRARDPWGNDRVAFTATTSIDRRNFGLEWNQILEAGGVLVGERVDIELDVQVVKAAASRAA